MSLKVFLLCPLFGAEVLLCPLTILIIFLSFWPAKSTAAAETETVAAEAEETAAGQEEGDNAATLRETRGDRGKFKNRNSFTVPILNPC